MENKEIEQPIIFSPRCPNSSHWFNVLVWQYCRHCGLNQDAYMEKIKTKLDADQQVRFEMMNQGEDEIGGHIEEQQRDEAREILGKSPIKE